MCQLLGMNCNVPTDICFSFTGFQARGGGTDFHADGWGIAFFEGKGVRLFLDPEPSVSSRIADLVKAYPIHSLNVIAHIRRSTQGVVSLENTHPFQRELWGRYWVFAHNGNLERRDDGGDMDPRPVGNTDSEWAFCGLMRSLQERFGNTAPERDALFDAVADYSRDIGRLGEFNFMLSNGDWLLAHCSTHLAYIVRRAPFAKAHLCDEDVTVDFNQVTTPNDRVAVIASIPLTDNEAWKTMPAGSLWLFEQGEPVRQVETVRGPDKPPPTRNRPGYVPPTTC
ncbi:MAG TPA: class II glutamine amidotransferase [Rhodocyclaceae bacterium]